ncbi:MAG: hypothetical protein U5R48_18095 [Gammaproteobacteria bacterium]|nr:hypothetical protein [Gammaproteobacteria bacterium]
MSELEALVGKRSSVPILHPVAGDVIAEANKIIVQYDDRGSSPIPTSNRMPDWCPPEPAAR